MERLWTPKTPMIHWYGSSLLQPLHSPPVALHDIITTRDLYPDLVSATSPRGGRALCTVQTVQQHLEPISPESL